MARPCVSTIRSMHLRMTTLTALLLALLVAAGCARNPVTGEHELSLISTSAEIARGEEYYPAAQQAGGGLYKADPVLTDYVADVGRRVAAVSDRPLPYEFVVLNTSSPNAWALPGGKIAITRGLLMELDNEAELAAVLGHEIVHAAARHSAQRLQRSLLSQLVVLGAATALEGSDHANYVLGASGLGLLLVEQTYGRDAERDADRYGMKYMHAAGYDTAAAVTLQEKFIALAEGREGGWLDGLFASHPASAERVENNRAELAGFPAGGVQGHAIYEERLAYLRAHREAYEAADRARQLLRVNPRSALQEVDAAIDQEPRESLFHGIKGQILARQGNHEAALRAYDEAVERDSGYYEHYLGRGLAYHNLGNRVRARSDLERSNELLATAAASFSLGEIALADGERAKAKRLFEAVSQTGGEIGEEAREIYIKLDIPDAPERYVTAETFFEHDQVIVMVRNSTGYELRNIVVRIDSAINGNHAYPRLHEVVRLAAHAFEIVRTGIHLQENGTVEVEVRILHAEPAS